MNAVTVGDLQLALENALLILEFTLAEQILSKLQRSVSRESFPVSAEDSLKIEKGAAEIAAS